MKITKNKLRRKKEKRNKYKRTRKMVYFNPAISIVTLNVTSLNLSIRDSN